MARKWKPNHHRGNSSRRRAIPVRDRKPVITIDYREIVWPDVIRPPDATESQRAKGVREAKVVNVCGYGLQIQAFCSVDLIAQVAPTDYRQNNDSLFRLARLLKSYEDEIGRLPTAQERLFLFDRWCLVARGFWRHSRDEYYAEFLDACHYARIGLDQSPIELAVSRAKSAPLPEVAGFTDERIRLLVAICREMQQITGANSFFLPTRKLGEILGEHWTQVGRWLRILEKPLEIIHLAPGEVRRRGGNRSPRYHYGPATQSTVGFSSVKQALSSTPLLTLTKGLPPVPPGGGAETGGAAGRLCPRTD